MNRICVWLTNLVTGLLDPAERDTVRGDFTELGVTPPRALLESFGLIARRQVELWNTNRPWVAVLGIIAPISMLLDRSWIGWLFHEAETLRRQGVRVEHALPLTDDIVKLLCGWLLVSTWAWIGGFTLSSVSRRTAWLPSLLCLGCFSFPVLAALFYRQLHLVPLTLIVETILILIPAGCGICHGARAKSFSLAEALCWMTILTAMTIALQVESGREHLAFIAWSNGSSLGKTLAWQAKPLPFAVILWQFGFLSLTGRRLSRKEINS